MSKRAVVVTDIWGAQWAVSEARATEYGFDLLLGRPVASGPQGATVILTDELTRLLHHLRHTPAHLVQTLPISKTAIRRLRTALGHHWRDDREEYYLDRIDDLAALTGPEFAARHGGSEAAASVWRSLLVGPRQRPAGWWRDPDYADAILTGRPRDAADALQISEGAIRRLRWMLRTAAAQMETTDDAD